MTWGLTAQRRADQFNAMVEDSSAVARDDARDAELLELVGALRTVPEINARPEFVTDLRALLMAEAHTGLSVGDAHKGTTMLGNASSRLDEVDALSQSSGLGDDGRIADTLSTFASQATSAADLLFADYADHGNEDSVVELRDFASSSLDQLEALEPLIPFEARDELIRAAGVLGQINEEAAERCPSCGGTPIESFPTTLLSSPAIVLPSTPVTSQVGDTTTKHDGKKKHHHQHGDKGDSSELPDVGDNVPPGSLLTPGGSLLPGTTQTGTNPLQTLTDGLTGRGTKPTSSPSVPVVSDLLNGVGDLLGDVVDPLTGQPQKP